MKIDKHEDAMSFRSKMSVREYRQYSNVYFFPVCPRCGSSLEMGFQSYCDRCGQALNWNKYHKAKLIKKSREI